LVGYLLYGLNFAVVMLNTVLDAFTQRAEQLPDWLQLYAAFILPASPVFIGVGIAFLFLLDPSKKIHDARAAAQAASMDALAMHMREAANRPDINAALQRAALKDVEAATSQVTGVRVVTKTPPALPKGEANGRAQSARRASRALKKED
jgi:hypothetical protein